MFSTKNYTNISGRTDRWLTFTPFLRHDPYVAKVEIWIDGELDHVAALPMRNTDRKVEPAWKYLMKEGRHHVKMKWLNRKKDYIIRINDIMYYSEKKEHDRFYFNK